MRNWIAIVLIGCSSSPTTPTPDAGTTDASSKDASGDATTPASATQTGFSLDGLPTSCQKPYYAQTLTETNATRVLHVSPNGDDANLAASPPCTSSAPCREVGALFAEVAGAPTDETMCDATNQATTFLKYLNPGDLVEVEDGAYQPFQIRQACGLPDKQIAVWAPKGGATVTGNITFSVGEGAVFQDGIFIHLSRYVTLDGFVTLNSTHSGIGLLLDQGIVLRNCEAGNASSWGFFTSYVTDLVMESNRLHDTQIQHGTYIGNSTQRVVVARNHFYDNQGAGLQVNPDASQPQVIPEFPFEGVSHCFLFDGNVLNHNAIGGGGSFNLQGLQDSVIRNNLIYDSQSTGITHYLGDASAGVGNNLIANNTIDVGPGGSGGGRVGIQIQDVVSAITVRNNIVNSNYASTAALAVGTAADIALIDSDYNALGSASSSLVLLDFSGADTPATLAQWQAMGKDAHSIGMPMASLVTAPYAGTTYDYHLQAGSLAHGAGVGRADLGVDMDNITWPASGAVNMGCYAK